VYPQKKRAVTQEKKIHIKAPFRRADFAAKAEIPRHEMAKGFVIGFVTLVAAPPALAAMRWLVPTLPHGFFRTAMTIICVVAIVSMFAFVLRGSRLTRRSGLVCPACGAELVGPAGTRLHPRSVQNQVLETGKCPACGAQLLDPTEVKPISRTSTRAEQAWMTVVLVVLVAGLVPYIYFAKKSIDANRLARCHNRYARAHSASDSIVVDSTRPVRDYAVTCGELLRTSGSDGGDHTPKFP
jgi:hypothetical protein